MRRHFTTEIDAEGDGYFALCPELDIASQGDTAEEARANLEDALALFMETASAQEIHHRIGAPRASPEE